MKFHFDLLEKINYTAVLHGIFATMEVKIHEAKLKNPKADYSRQEKAVSDLSKIYVWIFALYEEKELLLRQNLNLERLNLELKFRNSELEKRLKIETDLNKF